MSTLEYSKNKSIKNMINKFHTDFKSSTKIEFSNFKTQNSLNRPPIHPSSKPSRIK